MNTMTEITDEPKKNNHRPFNPLIKPHYIEKSKPSFVEEFGLESDMQRWVALLLMKYQLLPFLQCFFVSDM